MGQETKTQAPEKKKSGGLLGRLFGRVEHQITGIDARSGRENYALDLGDIQGFILRGYRMPMVRHFLLTVGVPAVARNVLGRLVSAQRS